jgi:hypothetical protein
LYSSQEQLILSLYDVALEQGQSIEEIDNTDILFFLDVLIYKKYSGNKNKPNEVYGDQIEL